MKKPKGYTLKVDNKMRDFGETDTAKKVIRINKKLHKKAAEYNVPKQDRPLINTIVHEKLHALHPKAHEKTVRKLARSMVAHMSPKQKQKHYKQFA